MSEHRAIVAAVQFAPKLLDVQHNLRTGQQLAFEAASKGATVIVLPELSMSGYVLRSAHEASSCCQTSKGYQTQAFIPIAKKYNAHIVFGFVELKEGKLYNSAAIVGPQGLVGTCQKHNLWGSDYMWAASAENLVPSIVTRAGRLGVLICRDAMNNYRDTYKFYQEGNRYYKKGSADTIALLTNWGADYGFPDSSWVELSEETGSNIIVSNRVGKERDMKYKGGSCVIDRQRKIWSHGSNFNHEAVVGGYALL